MITLYYNTISKELRNNIINKTLSEEEIEGIKHTLLKDYPSYKKYRKISNRFLFTALFSIITIALIFFLFILDGAPIYITPGSSNAKLIVFIMLAFLILTILCFIISAFFSMKYLAYVHTHHLMKLLKKHDHEFADEINKELGY